MKKTIMALVLALLVAQVVAGAALSSGPVAGCPTGFTPMMVMDMTDPIHRHIGTSADQNGDGWICMKHISNTVHLHIDNAVSFR
jgi:hypothetical protein